MGYQDVLSTVKWVAGVDEAGRGPLAGSVVAAAVILSPDDPLTGVKDSKKLSHVQRERFYDQIITRSHAFHIAEASVEEIDRINILQATMLAMKRAVEGLPCVPGHVLIDGNRCPDVECAAMAVVKGDQKVVAISAASILAKVYRDRQMLLLDERYPGYGFAQHKGYGTKLHLEALQRLGATPFHRRSFSPVAKTLALV